MFLPTTRLIISVELLCYQLEKRFRKVSENSMIRTKISPILGMSRFVGIKGNEAAADGKCRRCIEASFNLANNRIKGSYAELFPGLIYQGRRRSF